MTIQQALELALQYHQFGRLAEAEGLYRQILAVEPRHADALHLLGLIAHQVGRNEVAVDMIRQAIALHPNFPDAYGNLGNALRGKGDLDEAIAVFRHAITLKPNYPEAYSNLGAALRAKGQLDEAIAACRQAIAFQPSYAEAHNNLGNVLRDKGQLDEAIAAYRHAIAHQPNFPQAHSNLGNALRDKRDLDGAIAACRQAIVLVASYPEAHCNLGNALKEKGQLDEAIAAYRQAIALNHHYPEAHSNLGNALREKGELDEAIATCRRAIALKPNYAEAHSNLGGALANQGQLDEAIASYRQAIALKPNYPEAHSNLGNTLRAKGELDEAVAACRQAIALRSIYPEAYYNLGLALGDKGQIDEAIAAYRRAIALQPGFPDAYANLGVALRIKGQIDEAIAAYRHAIAHQPNSAEVHNNLGGALTDKGQLDEGIAAYRQAIALQPNFPEAHSNLVHSLHYHPGYDARAIVAEARRWNQQHTEPLRQLIRPHANDRTLNRRLRIGYVSPDFRDHPVGRFLLPLLAQHDRRDVEVFCYAQVPAPDAMTRQLQAHADQWHSLIGLTDEQAAALIRHHQIDILVDLALHTAHNRLLVFARKPAPVQITYLAYAGTSGLSTMDYRLSDPFLDPPGADVSVYSERTFRLPQTYWCYQPVHTPPIGPAPALGSGQITFGCLNSFRKVNEPVLEIWSHLLRAVPQAQLLLHATEGTHRQRTTDLLQKLGIDPRRLRFLGKAPLSEYLQFYGQIDIALDPFPYGGGTTTCDALWMSVPVISLKGNTAVGRAGLSLLSNVGLADLVAETPDEYVRLAAALANDLPRLTHLRSTLRQRMEQSPLMDASRFTRDIEAAYRRMWEDWCLEKEPSPP